MSTLRCALILILCGLDAGLALAAEKLPDGFNVAAVEAFPPAVELKHKYDYAQVLLTAKSDQGLTSDVTRLVKLAAPAEFVTLCPEGLLRPTGEGAGELTCDVNGKQGKVAVTVTGFTAPHAVSFVREVQPTL